MSRLIVKGLPSRYNDKELRDLFARIGEVTDAKVIKTKEGKSRQFGFVGFRTEQEAKSARHRLNKAYVDTSKVSVDFAHTVGDAAIPRPWSKYSAGSSLYERKNQNGEDAWRKEFLRKEAQRNERIQELKSREEEKTRREKDSKALEEFHATVGKRAANPLWADGGFHRDSRTTMVESRKNGGKGKMLERKHVTFKVDDSEDEDDALYDEVLNSADGAEEGTNTGRNMQEEPDAVAVNDSISDLDYFKSKVVGQGGVNSKGLVGAGEGKNATESQEESGDNDEQGDIAERPEQSVGKPQTAEVPGLRPAPQAERDPDGLNDEEQLSEPEEQTMPMVTTASKAQSDSRIVEDADASVTGRLLVRNLAFSVTSDQLEASFEKYGALADVHIVTDGKTGKSRGLGFVQFVLPENAPKALVEMDGTVLSGRIVHVLPARPRPQSVLRANAAKHGSDPGSSTFKIEREEARRDSARTGRDGKSQHLLHVSSDAVASTIAELNNASKADLYGSGRGESGVAAVRLAMAEAVVQNEAREYLLAHGVDLEAAELVKGETSANTAAARRKRQSRTAFLVKNLPARTTSAGLEKVFLPFGSVSKLIVIPSGLLGVVVYVSASDAKRAYNGLAYTRFRDTPLYLEWLPIDALKDGKDLKSNGLSGSSPSATENIPETRDGENADDREDKADDARLQHGSVYVKNLNFDTRDASLRSHFRSVLRKRPEVVSSLRSATVALKRSTHGDKQQNLSMGFGFLEFSSVEHAKEAVKLGQGTVLDGHTLELRLSNRVSDTGKSSQVRKRPASSTSKAGPKLIVRNVAFEATRRDIRQLFSAFGQLKVVRIPKKVDGAHRGFAFVEFVSKNEAKSAFKALSSTHLYGRRLVLEYAEEEPDVTGSVKALQEKTSLHVAKKKLRANDGTARDVGEQNNATKDRDGQAMLEDALYG